MVACSGSSPGHTRDATCSCQVSSSSYDTHVSSSSYDTLSLVRGRAGFVGEGWSEYGRPELEFLVASFRAMWSCEGMPVPTLLYWIQERREAPPAHCRALAWSYDGGASFVNLRSEASLFHKGHYQDSPLDPGIGGAMLSTHEGMCEDVALCVMM